MFDPHGLFRQAIQQYDKVNPRDLRDAEFFVNTNTLEVLQRHTQMPPEGNPYQRYGNTLLGLRVRIDDNMPDGAVALFAETELDRAVRRANERGHALNVMPPLPVILPHIPAPDPTLKALLKHWWKKCTQRVR